LELVITGIINPDVSRTVPVISLATGRVVDHHRYHPLQLADNEYLRKAAFEPAGA
jgi:hypothetical protein